MKNVRQKTAMIKSLIAVLFALGVSTGALAQPVRIAISWEPNPASEQVGWYIIEWNDAGVWKLLAQDSGVAQDGRLTYETVYDFATDYPVGTELCIRITAAKGTERSQPSENACASITKPPSDFTLSRPVDIDLELVIQ